MVKKNYQLRTQIATDGVLIRSNCLLTTFKLHCKCYTDNNLNCCWVFMLQVATISKIWLTSL